MSSSSTLHDWIGQMVWYFPRNDLGLQTHYTEAAIVIDEGDVIADTLVILLVGEEETKTVWVKDVQLMEDLDEDLERENGPKEESE